MPTIKISNEVYLKLQQLMEKELLRMMDKDPKGTLKLLIKNKAGITYSQMVQKLLDGYEVTILYK